MTDTVDRFNASLGPILEDSQVEFMIKPDLCLLADASEGFVLEDSRQLFEDVIGQAAPQWANAWLSLPDSFEWSWRRSDNAGEASLVHPLVLLNRPVDPAYGDILAKLGSVEELMVLDQTANVVSSSSVLLKAVNLEQPELFFFDTRTFAPLALDPASYLDLLSDNLGIDGWAFAFTDLPVTPDLRNRLEASAKRLEQANCGVQTLRQLRSRLS